MTAKIGRVYRYSGGNNRNIRAGELVRVIHGEDGYYAVESPDSHIIKGVVGFHQLLPSWSHPDSDSGEEA